MSMVRWLKSLGFDRSSYDRGRQAHMLGCSKCVAYFSKLPTDPVPVIPTHQDGCPNFVPDHGVDPLAGKWMGFLEGVPVTVRIDDDFVAVPCFSSKKRCLSFLKNAGVPSDVSVTPVESEKWLGRLLRTELPAVQVVYDVWFGRDGQLGYTLVSIE